MEGAERHRQTKGRLQNGIPFIRCNAFFLLHELRSMNDWGIHAESSNWASVDSVTSNFHVGDHLGSFGDEATATE